MQEMTFSEFPSLGARQLSTGIEIVQGSVSALLLTVNISPVVMVHCEPVVQQWTGSHNQVRKKFTQVLIEEDKFCLSKQGVMTLC